MSSGRLATSHASSNVNATEGWQMSAERGMCTGSLQAESTENIASSKQAGSGM
jgi:hypothetical protein